VLSETTTTKSFQEDNSFKYLFHISFLYSYNHIAKY